MFLRAEVEFSRADRLISALKELENSGIQLKIYSVDGDFTTGSVDTDQEASVWSKYQLANDIY